MGLRPVRGCGSAETEELARYLATTDVRGYGAPLRAGVIVASLVEIVSRDALGTTWTIFGNLGGIAAVTSVARPKFLVSEVRGVLRRRDCSDARSRRRLDELVAAERAGTLRDRRITLALTPAGPVIVDGNKRSVAIHEVAADDLVVPAFLIEAAGHQPLLRMP